MKSIFSMLVAGTFFSFSVAAQKDEPYFTKEFSESSANAVRVETSGGSISVEGDRSSGIKVEMYVRANNWNGSNLSKEEIEDRLRDYDVKIRLEGSTVVASAKRKGRGDWKNSVSIAFKVFTPRQMKTDLMTSGGSIQLSKLTGNQNFTTSGGSLRASDLKGNVRGVTSGGSIEASNVDGDINLETSGGSIRLNDLKGKIVAGTSGGSIRGEHLDGSVDVTTSGGSIRLNDVSGSVKGGTSAGSVEVEITKLGEYVDLSTSAGSVRVKMPFDKGLDLDLRGSRVSAPLSNFNGKTERGYIKGKMNGGGIPVTLSASSGSVYLNQ